MHGQLSPRDSNTDKQWIMAIIVYFTLGAALVAGISWDLSHRNGLSHEAARSADNPADHT